MEDLKFCTPSLVFYSGIDSADKLCIQTQPCAKRAAAGPGEPLARPWRDTQSQVSKEALLNRQFKIPAQIEECISANKYLFFWISPWWSIYLAVQEQKGTIVLPFVLKIHPVYLLFKCQIQRKELQSHGGNCPYCRPCSWFLQENLHQARVLPKPVWTSHGSGSLLWELLRSHQDQIQ